MTQFYLLQIIRYIALCPKLLQRTSEINTNFFFLIKLQPLALPTLTQPTAFGPWLTVKKDRSAFLLIGLNLSYYVIQGTSGPQKNMDQLTVALLNPQEALSKINIQGTKGCVFNRSVGVKLPLESSFLRCHQQTLMHAGPDMPQT